LVSSIRKSLNPPPTETSSRSTMKKGPFRLNSDELSVVLSFVTHRDLARASAASKAFLSGTSNPQLWRQILERNNLPVPASEWQHAVAVASASCRCGICGKSGLGVGRGGGGGGAGSRCPCVVPRISAMRLVVGPVALPRLCVGHFDTTRMQANSRTGSCFAGNGFADARRMLSERFELDTRGFPVLTDEALSRVHLLILETWSSRALASEEQASMLRFVQGGGCLLMNAFANWSVTDSDYSESLLAPFGLTARPRQRTIHSARTLICGPSTSDEAAAAANAKVKPAWYPARALVRGPFGPVTTVDNKILTSFEVPSEARAEGWLPLGNSGVGAGGCYYAFRPGCRWESTLGTDAPSTTRLKSHGDILVCTNFHWLCDRAHWNGGCLASNPSNWNMLLNFAAAAAVREWT